MIYPDNFEEKIDFTHIRETLKLLCISPLGIQRVDDLSFLTSFEDIDLLTGQTDEFRRVCLMESDFALPFYHDLTRMFHHIAIPGAFPAVEDIAALSVSLEGVRNTLAFFRGKDAQYPKLCRLTEDVDCFPDVLKAIERLIDHNGAIRDNASPTLADIRNEITAKQASVSRTMQRILKQAQIDGLAEEGTSVAIRDGRAVIPVNASLKRKINGIIHDESATGRTSYIEPAEVVTLNNAIRELLFAEQREIVRILTAFADLLRPHLDGLFHAFNFLGNMDFICAKAKLALKQNAVKPIFSPQQSFDWIRAVNPVMYLIFSKESREKEIVPLDISLTQKHRILLISGPNAGGKSVCLKTVGLIQYMFQCGLLIPMSENSEIGLFNAICIDIGDEQSIDNDLSTYSSHLLNMKQFIRHATPCTMILIDEFGSGTEPVIGGAIAEAVLSDLNAKGVWGVVTTHYSNLKYYASSAEGIVNGAMLYDAQRMQPLFRLETGKPGSSFAFEIARKIGLPENILAEAAEKAGRPHVDSDKHLREIERDKRYWERKRDEIRKHEKLLGELSEKQLTEWKQIEHERKSIIEQARIEALQIVAGANRAIENTIRTIKESQAEKETVRTVRKELEHFKERVNQITNDEEEVEKQNDANDKTFRKGDMVQVKGQDAAGEVMAVGGKTVTVAFGQLLSNISAERLVKISKNEYGKQHPYRTPTVQTYSVGERRLKFRPFVDVRGMRADEAIPMVEALLDDASMLGAGEVRILHGKGVGILRQVIRDYLKSSSAVASFDDEDIRQGGTGITVVKIVA
ncbi:MAG: Smr/MutS family protein [Bacteroidales bacterium]|jgi:DNA mismatch repair protein MutS2|nr:Smr/MutS family protein [Bacteroidales bacterium]